jgi:hypothetical protein
MSFIIPDKIKKLLEEKPNTIIIDGDYTYSIKDKQIQVNMRPTNTWEYVDPIREEMIEEANSEYFNMEHVWQRINDSEEYQIDRHSKLSTTPLDDFLHSSEAEMYPKPEIIIFLSDCFNRYFEMEGKESLEDIFFGKKKRGVGNHSAQKSRDKAIYHLSLSKALEEIEIKFSKPNENKRTDLELAEELVEKMKLKIDPESLSRKYRRYVKGK